MNTNFRVACDYLCVPDGIDTDGNLRLSVQVSPILPDPDGTRGLPTEAFIDIVGWPEKIAELSASIKVFAAAGDAIVGAAQVDDTQSIFRDLMLADHSEFEGESRAKVANRLWAKAFRYESPPMRMRDFDCLYYALQEAGLDTKRLRSSRFEISPSRSADICRFFSALDKARSEERLHQQVRLTDVWGQMFKNPASPHEVAPLVVDPTTPSRKISDAFTSRTAEIIRLDNEIAALFNGTLSQPDALRRAFSGIMRDMLPDEEENDELPGKDPAEDDWGQPPAEAGLRKLSAILSVPSLAAYLGCSLQLAIPKQRLADLGKEGIIRVQFGEDPNLAGNPTSGSQWTAYSLFGPDENEPGRQFITRSNPGDTRFKGEYLNLREERGDGNQNMVRRYSLHAISPYGSATATLAALRADPANEFAANGSEIKRRGIGCFDEFSDEELGTEYYEDFQSAAEDVKISEQIYYTRQLVRGHRPDIGVGATSFGDPTRWRELTQRQIRCTEKEMDQAFYADPIVEEVLLPRDSGFTMAPRKENKVKSSGDNLFIQEEKEPELFVWSGESLAVTRSEDEDNPGASGNQKTETRLHPFYDLGLSMEHRVGDGLLPPLREGADYFVGCRICLPNGVSAPPPTQDFCYSDPDLILGEHSEGQDTPFKYTRVEMKAPDVHLLWNDTALIGASSVPAQKGENSQTCVIRDGNEIAKRFVTPPRVSFDAAETQGQFDQSSLNTPAGAFQSRKGPRLWLAPNDGSLPEARYGDTFYIDGTIARGVGNSKTIPIGNEPDNINRQLAQPLGTVAILGNGNSNGAPYYVDANAGELKVELQYSIGMVAHSEEVALPFFANDPSDARPVVLNLRTGADFELETGERRIRDEEGRLTELPYVDVKMPEAANASLILRCGDGTRDENRTLKLVHAKKWPSRPTMKHGTERMGLNPVSVTISKDTSWADIVANHLSAQGDPLEWTSIEGGSATFFVGRVDLNRVETGTLRAEAEWEEYGSDTIQRVDTGGGKMEWQSLPPKQTAKLFEIDVEDAAYKGGDDWVDLLWENTPLTVINNETLRGLFYPFPDGRARKLNVTLTVRSAFTDYYNEATTNHETTYPKNPDNPATLFEVYTDCTFRPPVPKIERCKPLFHWTRDPSGQSCKRKPHLRVFLGEDWYASGVDEKLGVVLLPEDKQIGSPCEYYAKELLPYERFLSRPGLDPARKSSNVSTKLTADNLRKDSGNDDEIACDEMLFLADKSPEIGGVDRQNDAFLRTDIALYEVKVDEKLGAYVDIDIELGDDYQPFLHFGFVRFQPHALEHLRVSHPVEQIVQLLPERTIKITGNNSKWQVAASGPTYSFPGSDGMLGERPVFTASLFGWVEGSGSQFRPRWELLKEGIPMDKNDVDVGQGEWKSGKVDVSSFDNSHFMMLVEESEKIPSEDGGISLSRVVFSADVRI